MPTNSGPQTIPGPVIDLMNRIASYYGGDSVVDPCCYDPALLRGATYARRRVGMIHDRRQWVELVDEEPQLDLRCGSAFAQELDERFDIVLCGLTSRLLVPFHDREIRAETVILQKALALLNEGGTAICVLPENMLYARYGRDARVQVMADASLAMTVELPDNLCPGANLGASLVVLRPQQERGTTYLAKYQDDHDQIINDLIARAGHFWIDNLESQERWDRTFHDPTKREALESFLNGFPTRRLGEMAEVIRGQTRRGLELADEGTHAYYTGDVVARGFQGYGRLRWLSLDDDHPFQRAILQPGDIVMSSDSPKVQVYKESDPPAVASPSVYIIRTAEPNPYLASYLTSSNGRELITAQSELVGSRQGQRIRVSASQLEEFQIPIIPLSDPELLQPDNLETADEGRLQKMHAELKSARHLILRLRHRLETEEARHETTAERLQELKSWRDSLEQLQRFQESKFTAVQDRLDDISESLTNIHQVLEQEFSVAKRSSRDVDERLIHMEASLDRVARDSSEEERAIYERIVKTWAARWNCLHERSQTYLITAEGLFDHLDRQKAEDWSPFVLQYCRTVENELLHTMFLKYQFEITAGQNDLETYLAEELGHEKKALADYAKSIIRRQEHHTLGTFHAILGMLKPTSRTRRSSPFLTEFSKWVSNHFGEEILSDDHIDCVGQVKDLRNNSAHPYVVDLTSALRCRDLVRGYLNALLAHVSD